MELQTRPPRVLFYDTESFPAVKRAAIDIARESGKTFYNFKESYV
jgi:hypothetical protein